MNKEFVPYELALELMELGFNEPCLKYQWVDKKTAQWMCFSAKQDKVLCKQKEYIENANLYTVSIPLYQQAFMWLYQKTQKWIIPIPNDNKKGEWFGLGVSYKTYEEAELACLKKLIEIVKQNTNLPKVNETIDGSKI